MKYDTILSRLRFGDGPEKSLAVADMKDLIDDFISQALQMLRYIDGPHLVAQELFRYGEIIVIPAEAEFKKLEPCAAKDVIAILLLQLGSKNVIKYIEEIVLKGGDYQCLAVGALSKMKIDGAADIVIRGLRGSMDDILSSDDPLPILQTFFSALQRVDSDLPPDLRARLASRSIPGHISSLVEAFDRSRRH